MAIAAEAPEGARPLHRAAERDDADAIRALVQGRADVASREPDFGWSALHLAAGRGCLRALEALLELGLSPDDACNDGETPLFTAAENGQVRALQRLVEARADVNRRSDDGETPLHVAVQHLGSKPLSHVRALLALGADPSLKDQSGHTPWDCAGLYTNNRADEVRAVLAGRAIERDPEDPWPESPSELPDGTAPLTVAEDLRARGNDRFRQGRLEDALKFYFKAKRFLPTGPAQYEPVAEGDVEAARARACYLAVCSNAATCTFKLGRLEECVNMCDGIMVADPRHVKAHFRKAVALRSQGDLEAAAECLRRAAELEPGDREVQRELAELAAQRKREKEHEKKLAQKMFG